MPSPNRIRLIAGAALLLLLVAGLWLYSGQASKPAKRSIALMSSIALQWGEVDIAEVAKGTAQRARVFGEVSDVAIVTMIDRIEQVSVIKPDALVLVQPHMLSPSDLVALDNWVRSGGRAIIFADPALQWPSRYPHGDNRRPLFTSFLNPLFKHWGVELVLPVSNESEQEATVEMGNRTITVISHGNWVSLEKNGPCHVAQSALVATCRLGKGRAVLVADADMLQDDLLDGGIFRSDNAAWFQEILASQINNSALPQGM